MSGTVPTVTYTGGVCPTRDIHDRAAIGREVLPPAPHRSHGRAPMSAFSQRMVAHVCVKCRAVFDPEKKG